MQGSRVRFPARTSLSSFRALLLCFLLIQTKFWGRTSLWSSRRLLTMKHIKSDQKYVSVILFTRPNEILGTSIVFSFAKSVRAAVSWELNSLRVNNLFKCQLRFVQAAVTWQWYLLKSDRQKICFGNTFYLSERSSGNELHRYLPWELPGFIANLYCTLFDLMPVVQGSRVRFPAHTSTWTYRAQSC